MQKTILTSLILFLFFSCTSAQKQNESNAQSEKYDLTSYLHKLDSIDVDISNDTTLFEIGYQNLYFGKNERGNALIEYALAKRNTVAAEEYRHWSVQNTKNGDYGKAIELLEKSLKLEPREVSAYYGWVALYYYRDYDCD